MKIVAHISCPVLTKICLLILGLVVSQSSFSQTCFHAEFSSEIGYDGCTVYFTDQSVGDISSWEWQFGDGGTSTQQNPTHYYGTPGCYNVTLTITQANETKVYSEQVCPTCVDGSGSGSFFASISGPPNVYVDGSYNFESTISGGVPPYDYYWQVQETDGGPSFCGNLSGGGFDPNVLINFGAPGCISGDNKIIYLLVTDNFGNQATAIFPVIIDGTNPDCEIDVSGSLNPGETTKFKIHATFLGTDCFDVYPYWTWDYGDGTTPEGPMFWVTWHDYQAAGTYTVTATGCVDPYYSTNCVTVVTTVTIGPIPEPPSGPYFYIQPSQTIDAYIGEPMSENLSVGVNYLPPNYPGEIEIEHYEVVWKFIDSYTNTQVYQYTIGPLTPSQLTNPANSSYSFTPTTDMYGCLDVILEVYPWGYYNGVIDLDCDGELTAADNGCGGPCIGYIGANTPVNLGIENYNWGGQTSGADGCVGEDASASFYGENFPFTVRENCKIDVFYEPIDVLEILLTDDCSNPYLEVEVEKGATQSTQVPPPSEVPCTGYQNYQNYEWKAFSINDPTVELENFFTLNGGPTPNSKCVYFDPSHPYFQDFEEGQLVIFICEVTVTDYFGVTDSHTKMIGIDLPLQINLPSEISVCSGTSGFPVFEEPIASGGNGSYTYTWVGNAYEFLESVGTTVTNPPVFDIPSNYSGNYSVNLIVNSGANCSVNSTITFNINHLEVDINTDETLCAGASGLNNTLSANVTGGTGNYSYLWQSPAAQFDDYSSPNPTLLLPPPGGIQCQLTVMDDTGCTAADLTFLAATSSNPVADINVLYQPNHVCYGTSLTLGGKGNPGSGVPQLGYSWTSTNPLFIESDEIHPVLTPSQYDEPGMHTYTLTVYDETNGCYDQTQQYVNVHPQWEYTGFESEIKTILEGESVLLWGSSYENRITGGAVAPFDYSWSPLNPSAITYWDNNTQLPRQGSFSPTINTSTRTMTVTDGNKCTKEFISDRYVVLESDPFLHISTDPPNVSCVGDGNFCTTVTLHTNYIGNTPWFLPSEISCNLTVSVPSGLPWIFSMSEDLSLELTDDEAGVYQAVTCMNINTNSYLPLEITASIDNQLWGTFSETYPYSIFPSISVDEYKYVCNPGGSGAPATHYASKVLIGNTFQNTPNCYESWMLSGQTINFIGGDFVRFLPNLGYYTEPGATSHAFINQCLTVSGFAEDSEKLSYLLNDTNIAEPRKEDPSRSKAIDDMVLQVQPNPFSHTFEISFNLDSGQAEMVQIEILHMTGQLIERVFTGLVKDDSQQQLSYDGSDLPPGIYICRMQTTTQGSLTERIVKVSQ